MLERFTSNYLMHRFRHSRRGPTKPLRNRLHSFMHQNCVAASATLEVIHRAACGHGMAESKIKSLPPTYQWCCALPSTFRKLASPFSIHAWAPGEIAPMSKNP